MAGLHPAMQTVLQRLATQRAGQPDRYSLPFEQARVQLLRERLPWLADGPPCASTERMVRSGGQSFGMRVYEPPRPQAGRLLIYLHGGGWSVGSPQTHDNIVRRLAVALDAEAWSVDYALAPEAPYPAGLRDCMAATRLAAAERPGLQLVLAGDSAGANLALDTALRLRDEGSEEIDALLLFYGVYTDDCSGTSMEAFGDGRYGLSLQAHRRYLQAYSGEGNGGAGGGARAIPFALQEGTNLRGLPRCWLASAELDILRDQSHVLAGRLRQAGVSATLDPVPGVIHGFLSYGGALPQVDEVMQAAARWVAAGERRTTGDPGTFG